jgi:cell division protein FtsW (lipid II flippase)
VSAAQATRPRTARRREQGLLASALGIVLVAGGLLLWAIPSDPWPVALAPLLVLVALGAGVHGALRLLAPQSDPVLVPLAMLLNGFGLVLIRRVDLAEGTSYAGSQLVWSVLGWSSLIIVLAIIRDHRWLTRLSYTFGLLTLVLLLLPLAPFIGTEVNGARLWIDLGPLRIQPGELAKLTLVVFLAGYLEKTRALLTVAQHRIGPLLIPAPRHLAPLLSAVGLSLLVLVLQKDLGSSLLLFGIVVVMLYVATARVAYPLVGLAAFSVGAVIAFRLFGHLRSRVAVWLDPFADPLDSGYQIVQVLFAIANGGVTGTGLGRGHPDGIPFSHTDAIFAVAGEELGLLGATAILVVYGLLIARGMAIAVRATDEVGTLLAVGFTTILALQVFVIVGGLTRIIPLTGITMPLVSYGGSALISNLVLLALLLRISDDANGGRSAPTLDAR